jgi:hypothetical protein
MFSLHLTGISRKILKNNIYRYCTINGWNLLQDFWLLTDIWGCFLEILWQDIDCFQFIIDRILLCNESILIKDVWLRMR